VNSGAECSQGLVSVKQLVVVGGAWKKKFREYLLQQVIKLGGAQYHRCPRGLVNKLVSELGKRLTYGSVRVRGSLGLRGSLAVLVSGVIHIVLLFLTHRQILPVISR
jgi:hypothetical protein